MTVGDPKRTSELLSETMILRLSVGIAGLVALLLGFTWTQVFSTHSNSLLGTWSGLLTAVIVIFGVYLVFYGLTGDWLPNLRKPGGKD